MFYLLAKKINPQIKYFGWKYIPCCHEGSLEPIFLHRMPPPVWSPGYQTAEQRGPHVPADTGCFLSWWTQLAEPAQHRIRDQAYRLIHPRIYKPTSILYYKNQLSGADKIMYFIIREKTATIYLDPSPEFCDFGLF